MRRRVPALGTAPRFCCLFLMLVFGGKLRAQSEELISRPAVFLEVIRPQRPEDSDRYGEVISQLIRITLRDAGLELAAEVPGVIGGFPPAAPDPEALLERARGAQADYLLAGSYFEDSGFVGVRFCLLDVAAGTVAAETTGRNKVDLSFDRFITDAVQDLLDEVGDDLVRYEKAKASPEANPSSENTTAGGGEPEPIAVPDGDTLPAAIVSASPIVESRARFRSFELAAGSAPFLPLGKASDYFKVGLFSALSGVFRWDLGAARLGIGLEAGTSLFAAQGASGAAQTVLAPFGGLVVLNLSYGTPLELTIRISGGGALLSMSPDGLGRRLNKMLPYGSGGIGLNVEFGPSFGLAVDTRFAVYFEQAYGRLHPLLGITPTLYLVMRV